MCFNVKSIQFFVNTEYQSDVRGCQHLCATVAVNSRPLVVFSLQCYAFGCRRCGRAWLSVKCAHVRGNRAPVPQGAISPSIAPLDNHILLSRLRLNAFTAAWRPSTCAGAFSVRLTRPHFRPVFSAYAFFWGVSPPHRVKAVTENSWIIWREAGMCAGEDKANFCLGAV